MERRSRVADSALWAARYGLRGAHKKGIAPRVSALYKMSVRAIEWIKLNDQKTHDSQILPDIQRLKGSLFLFDLGYFSHLFLYQLNQIQIWFVCRLKANSVPIITRVVKDSITTISCVEGNRKNVEL